VLWELFGLLVYLSAGSALLAHVVAPNGVAQEAAPTPTPAPLHIFRVPDRRITVTIHMPDRTVRCTTSTDLVVSEDIVIPSEEFDELYQKMGCNSWET
jgi:hypothetical protein